METLTGEIKNALSLSVFKTTDNYPCTLCKTFVKDFGFSEVFTNLQRNP